MCVCVSGAALLKMQSKDIICLCYRVDIYTKGIKAMVGNATGALIKAVTTRSTTCPCILNNPALSGCFYCQFLF